MKYKVSGCTMDFTWQKLSSSLINQQQIVNLTHLVCVCCILLVDYLVGLLKKMENEVYQLAKKWFAALSNATKVGMHTVHHNVSKIYHTPHASHFSNTEFSVIVLTFS